MLWVYPPAAAKARKAAQVVIHTMTGNVPSPWLHRKEMAMRLAAALVLLPAAALLAAGPARSDEPKKDGRQEAKTFDKDITVRVKMNYLLYLPKDYKVTDKTWPLLLFLHGAGESGDNLNKVKVHGPPKLVESGKDFPFIIVSPQSARFGWDTKTLAALLDEVQAKYRVDADRVYVTGLSMGGFGTWALAAAYPNRFAAIAPICGGGEPITARKIKDMPIWAFHGAKDKVVPPSRSEAMIKSLRAAGAKEARLTIYPDAGHDSWTETYNNPELYTWLLDHQRRPAKDGK
jgi:predicted peptidase